MHAGRRICSNSFCHHVSHLQSLHGWALFRRLMINFCMHAFRLVRLFSLARADVLSHAVVVTCFCGEKNARIGYPVEKGRENFVLREWKLPCWSGLAFLDLLQGVITFARFVLFGPAILCRCRPVRLT